MQKLKFVLAATLALASPLARASDSCFSMDPIACQAFTLTNVERAKAGLPALEYSPLCFAMAQEQSNDMAEYHYFDHQRPATPGHPAENFMDRATRFGLQNGVGENIAFTTSPERALAMWMRSEGHRRNILDPRFRHLGVGYKDGLYTQSFGD